MKKRYRDFIEMDETDSNFLRVSSLNQWSPSGHIWSSNGLSADYISEYVSLSYRSSLIDHSLKTIEKLKQETAYIVNELLENCVRHSDPGHPGKILSLIHI